MTPAQRDRAAAYFDVMADVIHLPAVRGKATDGDLSLMVGIFLATGLMNENGWFPGVRVPENVQDLVRAVVRARQQATLPPPPPPPPPPKPWAKIARARVALDGPVDKDLTEDLVSIILNGKLMNGKADESVFPLNETAIDAGFDRIIRRVKDPAAPAPAPIVLAVDVVDFLTKSLGDARKFLTSADVGLVVALLRRRGIGNPGISGVPDDVRQFIRTLVEARSPTPEQAAVLFVSRTLGDVEPPKGLFDAWVRVVTRARLLGPTGEPDGFPKLAALIRRTAEEGKKP